MNDFYKTVMGNKFYLKDVPDMIKEIKVFNNHFAIINELKSKELILKERELQLKTLELELKYTIKIRNDNDGVFIKES